MWIAGKACKYTDVDNPDWVPTLRLGYVEEYLDAEYLNEAVQVETSNEMDDSSSIEIDTVVETSNVLPNEKQTQTFVATADVGTQTDSTITGMSTDIVLSNIEQIQMLER